MKKPTKLNWFVLIFTKVTAALPAAVFFKPKVYLESGSKAVRRLPAPSILVSNHTSLMDFPFYLTVFPFRTICFLMAEVLFNQAKILKWFLECLGGIKVDRDAFDFGFVADSLKVLDRGGIVGVFPQGRLPVNGVPFPFKPSVAFIALHTDAPVIPVYTDGQYGINKRGRVIIGEAIDVRDYLSCEREPGETDEQLVTRKLEEKVYALKADMEAQIGKNK